MMPVGRVIFSIDYETVGLLGEPFAAAFSISNEKGEELQNGYFSCPIENAKGLDSNREWVITNVVPHLPVESNCKDPDEVCERIYQVWIAANNAYKEVLAIADYGFPVESGAFVRVLKIDETQREFKGPFPLHEVATALLVARIDRTDYPRIQTELPEHNPLNDARYAARLFMIALNNR